MINSIVVGRGDNRQVFERSRNFKVSQAIGDAIKQHLGLSDKHNFPRRTSRPNKA